MKYPEIWEAVNTKKLEPYSGPMKCGYAQLFVGRQVNTKEKKFLSSRLFHSFFCSQGTGTPFHSASNSNWFYMIDGRKKWYFIDPYDSYLCNPMMRIGNAAAASLALYPDDYAEEVMPAMKYCPYYTADLEPGDVLFNPTWWHHAIRLEERTHF